MHQFWGLFDGGRIAVATHEKVRQRRHHDGRALCGPPASIDATPGIRAGQGLSLP